MGFFSSLFGKSAKKKEGEKQFILKVNELIDNPDENGSEQLALIRQNYDLSKLDCEKIVHDHFKTVVESKLDDDRIDDTEYNHILQVGVALGVDVMKVKDVARTAWIKHAIWDVEENNTMPGYSDEVEIALKSGEVIYHGTGAILKKEKTRTERINYSGPVVSFRICKSVTYRSGSMKMQSQKVAYIDSIDQGTLYLTNKRIAFIGAKKNFSYPYDKIMRVEVSDVGLVIHKENLANPQIVELNDYELVLVILSKIFNN